MDEPREYIERLDNPELSRSEQFDLGMEADFNMQSDHMMAYAEAEWCGDYPPTLEELEADERRWEAERLEDEQAAAREEIAKEKEKSHVSRNSEGA